MSVALQLDGVTKRYGEKTAVDNISLSVQPGEMYALLGPNGAGKTTTLRMICGLLRPDAGQISAFGVDVINDPMAAKRLIAWAPDEPQLYDRLNPMEYLEFVAALWECEPKAARALAQELLERLGLWENRLQRCETFSRGMKQKTALAGALIHDPKLLLLDEPLTGLDAAAARLVKDMLAERLRAGGAIILTTHILDVAERMADRIGIIRAGALRAEGNLAQLRAVAGESGSLEDVFLRLVAPDELVS